MDAAFPNNVPAPATPAGADRQPEESPWSRDAAESDACSPIGDPLPIPLKMEFGASFPVLAAGYVGTLLAGALFPTAVFLLGLIHRDWTRPFPGANAELILVGLFVGGFWAGGFGAMIFPLVAMIQLLGDMYRQRAITATVAGGWTGFAATYSIAEPMASPPSYVALLTAMLMGQIGAGWLARRAEHWQNTAGFWPVPDRLAQFRLVQLFGLTAGVALVAAILSLLQLSSECITAMGVAAAFQTATIGGYLIWTRSRPHGGGST